MILVDTSIWIDHIRATDNRLAGLLEDRLVVMHPFVLGELLLGGLAPATHTEMLLLPRAETAAHEEVVQIIARWRLAGRGLGYVDAHLAASAMLSQCTVLTRDTHLRTVAEELGVGFSED